MFIIKFFHVQWKFFIWYVFIYLLTKTNMNQCFFFLIFFFENYEQCSYVKSYSSSSLLFVKQLLFCELLAFKTISSKIIFFHFSISFIFTYSCTYDCKLSHSSIVFIWNEKIIYKLYLYFFDIIFCIYISIFPWKMLILKSNFG